MNEFKHYINGGYAYRKTFPGSNDLAYFCLLTREQDEPDTAIINIRINKSKLKDIVKVVDICSPSRGLAMSQMSIII